MNIPVNDQSAALGFYTSKLGFIVKDDMPMGPMRWLTVVSPHDPDGVEIVLQATAFPGAAALQQAQFAAGMPAAAFHSADVRSEYTHLKHLGVTFRGEPVSMGPITAVLFEDTCGNLINLVQPAT